MPATFVVEDGTGLPDANAYVSVEEVDTYAQNYGKENWLNKTQVEKEKHIRRATQFIDSKYPWTYPPKVDEQSLTFPGDSVYIRGRKVEGVPRQVRDATSELSIISVTTDLVDSVGARVYNYRQVKIGDIEKTEKYTSQDDQNQFYTVEMILRPILSNEVAPGLNTFKLKRA